jgi:4-amino-4-deoxy-L-arabinose transferase-like glycosyltransferase
MMNPFNKIGYTFGYTSKGVSVWLTRDPSLYLAVILSMLTYRIGIRIPEIRMLVAAFVVSFLPLTIWIWDIPFTDSMVCLTFHDANVFLAEGVPLKSRHVYLLCMALFGLLMLIPATRRGLRGIVTENDAQNATV